jgi:DNA-binding IclR family transcriptional regulator
LNVIKKTGIGTYDSEYFDNSVSIAVPIGGRNKRIFMAVAVHGPAPRLTMEICMNQFLPVLERAAEAITSILIPQQR